MSTPSTPYRTEIDALNDRKTALEAEIAQIRAQTQELASLEARQADLARELAAVDARLRAGGVKRALPMLDDVRVASPCDADWDQMLGVGHDDRVRFCLKCDKNVFNLSAMTRDEAEALLEERLGGELCVRFYQRADGTLLTEDCPVGVTKKRRKKLALAAISAGAMALGASALAAQTCRTGKATMGDVAFEPSPPRREQTQEPPAPVPPVMGSAVVAPPEPWQPGGRRMMGAIARPRDVSPPLKRR